MFLLLLVRQFIGFFLLFVPFLLLYSYKPQFMLSFYGALIYALLVGFRTGYVYYQSSKNLVKGLKFVPSGSVKNYFEEQVKEVGLNPQDIAFRYAYCDSNIALTVFNTIIIDQMMWHGCDEDSVCVEAQNLIKIQIQPVLLPVQKKFHQQIKGALTPDAQRFIFKHELGHVVDNYSWKRIILNGIIGFGGMYSGIFVGKILVLANYGLVSLLAGIITGGVVDLLLTFVSNVVFKAPKETGADSFAIKHSSKKEIAAAADFFEKYEIYAIEYRKTMGDTISDSAPRFFRGYAPSKERVAYLRNAANFVSGQNS